MRLQYRPAKPDYRLIRHWKSGVPSANAIRMAVKSGPITEQLLALLPEKTTDHWNLVMALLKHESAGYETSSPLVVFRAMLPAICGNVLLRDTVDNGADSRPYACTGAHGARFMSRVENEVR